MNNYRQQKAIEARYKKIILSLYPDIPDTSGIYIYTRTEDGIKYAYIGQSVHLLTRLAQHFMGFQHIDNSLKKRGLFPEKKDGWAIEWYECSEAELDHREQVEIVLRASEGYQLLNETIGGQGDGKKALGDRSAKGYRKGVDYGYKKALKDIKHLFDLHLNVSIKSDKPNKNQEKALIKFKELMEIE